MRAGRHIFALLACSLAGLAMSQTPGTPSSPVAGTPPSATLTTNQPLPPSRWTQAQIREAFQRADLNSDGQLSRAEAQRLAILPRSFEDTDANKDGALVLSEYETSFSP